ncbi:hypothetical protein BOO34_18845 [Vibrio navarrensis]|nr:hypothetical protein [Vibrio navarrensis]
MPKKKRALFEVELFIIQNVVGNYFSDYVKVQLKQTHNKRFKRDNQRVAFLLRVVFVVTVLCGKLVVALVAP